jgi:hypothetical protein
MTPRFEHLPSLLTRAGLPGPFQVRDLPGGGNNKVYRIQTPGKAALLKVYFRDPADTRDRLGAEFAFSTFAWNAGIRVIPQPLAQDEAEGMAMYEFLDGRPLVSAEVNESAVQQAISLFCEVNRHKVRPDAQLLRSGSEACFTMAEHLACVDRRMKRFIQLDCTRPVGHEARKLVDERLIPAWTRIRANVVANGAALDAPLQPGDRCLSPSDFGFHNSIDDGSGRLKFVDFEYAGWDDPAKTVCDFFCQPDVVVPPSFFGSVSRAFVADLSDPESHLRRIDLLLPVYRVKWCCIMLNDFLPLGSRRRAFAKDPAAQEQRRIEQLRKVRLSLDALGSV